MENFTSDGHGQHVLDQIEIENQVGLVDKGWKKNIVRDLHAPAYYSQQAIWAFSTFFTVIFGAVLLAINLKGNAKGKWMVVGFGFLYTALAILALFYISTNIGVVLTINAMGGFILTQLFWDKYIGEDTKYRTSPILRPLFVALVIITALVILLAYELLNVN